MSPGTLRTQLATLLGLEVWPEDPQWQAISASPQRVAMWEAACTAARTAIAADRTRGHGRWRRTSTGLAWQDVRSAEHLRAAWEREVGRAVLDRRIAAEVLREDSEWLDRLLTAPPQDITAPPRPAAQRVLLTWSRVPSHLRDAIAEHRPWRQEGPTAQPWDHAPHPHTVVDSAQLPSAVAAQLIDTVGEPDIVLLEGDLRDTASWIPELIDTPLAGILEDPPYDTGGSHLPYDDAFAPGAWATLLRERLLAAKQHLVPGAVLALHIDEHQVRNLEHLVREVFGPDGFLGTAVWDKRNPKGDASGIANQHELIVWATTDSAAFKARGGLRRPKANAEAILAKAREFTAHGVTDTVRERFRRWVRDAPGLTGGERAYHLLDDDGVVYRRVSMAWPNKRRPPDGYFEPVLHPVTGKPCPVPRRGWRNPPDTMQRLLTAGELLFGPDHTTQPTRKYRLADHRWENLPSVLYFAASDDAWQAAAGVKWPHAKPVAFVARLLQSVVPEGHGWVWDAFGGSGTTAHAMLRLNATEHTSLRAVLSEVMDIDTTLLPRLVRAARSDSWLDGRPGATGGLPMTIRCVSATPRPGYSPYR